MAEPKLSVVLGTDDYPIIQPVVERFRAQTVRDQLEIVFVAPSASLLEPAFAYRDEFAGMKVVEHSVDDLGSARAAGVRGSTAEYVFIGETHSYPYPRMCEVLITHFPQRWAAVMPAMDNGNPKTSTSWAAFLADYGRWVTGLPEGITPNIPIYNAAFRKDVLLSLGDELATAIRQGEPLADAFHAGSHQVYFETDALIDHLNVAPVGHWTTQRFVLGMMIGRNRSRGWPLGRRAFYLLASPLIPLVLLRRMLPGLRSSFQVKGWPISTMLWIAAGLTIKTIGEAAAYAGVPAEAAIKRNHDYEMNKLAYTDLARR